jgi:glycosyltransferase involved in cell wall biosynthesis
MINETTISILTPTRNRPNNCERFIKSIYATASDKTKIELFFYVDNDDPALEQYKSLAAHCDS